MMTADEVFFMSGVELKASREVYRKHRINRQELNLLCCLTTVLSLKKRKAIAMTKLFEWLGVGTGWVGKAQGYIFGLHKKGCIHKLDYVRNGKSGNSLAITEYGARVLELYFKTVSEIEQQKPAKYPTYKSNAVHSSRVQEDLPLYILRSPGRDE
jgi:hypothetical protein